LALTAVEGDIRIFCRLGDGRKRVSAWQRRHQAEAALLPGARLQDAAGEGHAFGEAG
jgi:hypothetical protein